MTTARPLNKLLATPKQKSSQPQRKPAPIPKPCVCRCGEMTKGGEFLPGHDARYKSHLIKEAKAGGNDDAIAELERRGWTKFLEKSIHNDEVQANRKAGVRTPCLKIVQGEGAQSPDYATDRYYRYRKAQRAIEVLQSVGRYGKSSGERRIEIHLDAAYLDSIIEGSHPDYTDEDRAIIEGGR